MNVFFLAATPESLEGNYGHVAIDDGGGVFNLDPEHPVNRYQATSDIAQLRPAACAAPAAPIRLTYFPTTSACPRWTAAFPS
jgi:hypothetical protein